MRTLRVRLLATGLVALIGLGFVGLLAWATLGVLRAETARHEAVADRIVDAMEAELSDLVAREEARSFLEYRSYYLPERNAGLGNVVRSPLTDGPDDPLITAYFQRDPDGTVNSPRLPRANELELALNEGWRPRATAQQELVELEQAVGTLDSVPVGDAPTPVPPRAATSLSKLSSFGSGRRSVRGAKEVATNQQSLAIYQTDEVVQQAYGAAPTLPPGDVRVSPLRGRRQGDDLVLFRSVDLGDRTTLQGFLLDRAVLQRTLYERVVVATDLADHVDLAWGGAQAEGTWAFDHRFAEPFDSLTVRVGLQRLPGLAGMERQLLWGLSIGGLLLVGLVGAALWWAVRTELAYAQRRSDFVAAVSHELKTPLTSIRMYAEMLRDGMVPDPARQAVYHGTITAESERLTRLIANVLELSRLEQGGPRPSPVAGELRPLVEEAAAMLRPHAETNGVSLEVDLPDLPPVLLERDALLQVLMNLVDNAIKFGGPGTVRLTALERDGRVELAVQDQGPGVPQRQLRHIFEAFYRGERELTRTTKGTGIGLALVAGLVGDMGGRVRAANRAEGGLEVVLTLRPATS